MAADVVLNAGRAQLLVEGAPFLILGGEVHNSSASGLEWMEEKVWPVVRQLRLNTLLVPVYWETVEPREGEFHFELVDGVLAQARREGVRLVLLWFGLWKNALSTYAPSWVKQDTKRFFEASCSSSWILCAAGRGFLPAARRPLTRMPRPLPR